MEISKYILHKLKTCLCLIYLFILEKLTIMRIILQKFYSKLRKENLIKLTNLICLIFLIYNAVDMTIDFLQFDYEYNLIVDFNKNGIDLTPINVCTESNTLLNRRKVINNFDIDLMYNKYESDAKVYLFPPSNLPRKFPNIHRDCDLMRNKLVRQWREMEVQGNLKWYFNLCLNRFYQHYERFIFAELNFDELNALTFESNELFGFSAKLHSRNKTTIEANKSIDNFSDKYSVKKSIKANKEFGICYTFFDNNHDNKEIFFEIEDFINISLNFQKQKQFIVDNNKEITKDFLGKYDKHYLELYSNNYFRLFIL